MQPILNEVLEKRRNRALAIILGLKERECDPYLPPDVSAKLRKVILDQLNDFYDLCADVMRSLDTGEVVLNQVYLEKLDAIHEKIVEKAS